MLWRKIEFSKLQLLQASSSQLFSLIKRPRSIDNVYVKRLNAESSFPSHSSQNFSSYIDRYVYHTRHPRRKSKRKVFQLNSRFVIYNKRQLSFPFEEWGTVKNRQQNDESRKQKKLKIRKWIKTFYRFDDNFLPSLDISVILMLHYMLVFSEFCVHFSLSTSF